MQLQQQKHFKVLILNYIFVFMACVELKAVITNQHQKWAEYKALNTKSPRYNPICDGDSIWIASKHGDGENGMIKLGATKEVTQYPSNGFKPKSLCFSTSNTDKLLLIDGKHGKVLSFNTKNRIYGDVLSIPAIGNKTSSLMIKGNVHIFHGEQNAENQYLIYSMKTGKVTVFKSNVKYPRMFRVSFTKKEDDSEFYKFGGFNFDANKYEDSFFVGTLQNGDASKPIIWKKNALCTLKKALARCGVIQFGPFIVTFGGMNYGRYRALYLDEIYILDTRSKMGWVESTIKCPMKSAYVAVLDHLHKAHLFTFNQKKHHFCIALKELIPELGINSPSIKEEVSVNELNDDEKGINQEQREMTNMKETSQHQDLVTVLRVENERLTNELERVKRENAEYQEEHKEFEMKIAELQDKVKELEAKTLDTSRFMDWHWKQIHLWIMGLNAGKYKKYEAVLKDALSEDETVGEDLLEVTAYSIKYWGIKDKDDRQGLSQHIRDLVHHNEQNDVVNIAEAAVTAKENEGSAPTAFVSH